jgi:2-polyprenyl-6-methoxyphenol hydroxylase-like FAD-dependent oxidoreductase
MMDQPSAGLVLGGGIAGLAFAAAMNRLGQPTTVLEAAEALRAHGSGVVLGPTAMMLLRRLGLRDQVISSGKVLKRKRCVGPTLRW